jgi:hypothetical protein
MKNSKTLTAYTLAIAALLPTSNGSVTDIFKKCTSAVGYGASTVVSGAANTAGSAIRLTFPVTSVVVPTALTIGGIYSFLNHYDAIAGYMPDSWKNTWAGEMMSTLHQKAVPVALMTMGSLAFWGISDKIFVSSRDPRLALMVIALVEAFKASLVTGTFLSHDQYTALKTLTRENADLKSALILKDASSNPLPLSNTDTNQG